jgi:hypothetical protein
LTAIRDALVFERTNNLLSGTDSSAFFSLFLSLLGVGTVGLGATLVALGFGAEIVVGVVVEAVSGVGDGLDRALEPTLGFCSWALGISPNPM